jgi:hypothetical protein
MKTYQLAFDKNCESMLRDIALAWNEDSVLGKLGYIEEEANNKKVYDVSVLSQVCLSLVTGVASAIIYDGLKRLITSHLKKAYNPKSEVRITLNEHRSTIFISLEPNEETRNEEVKE